MPYKIDLSSINKKNNIKSTNDNPQKSLIKNIEPEKPKIPEIPTNILHDKIPTKKPKSIKPKETSIVLSELERSKKIKLLELYVAEFPDKLEKYKNHKFNKCTDQQLINFKSEFDKAACSSNNLHWGVSISQQALQVYEMIGKMGGLEINGIAKMGYSEEWIKNIKAVCLKYLDGGITFIEPEHQLLFMIFQQTLLLHYLNTTNVNKELPENVASNNEISKSNNNAGEFSDGEVVSPIRIKLELQQLTKEYGDL